MEEYRDHLITLTKKGKRLEGMLQSNDFKEFILDGFCSEYLNKCLEQGTDIHTANKEDYLLLVQAVGIFKNYIKSLKAYYADAEMSLKQLDEETND